MSAQLDLNLEAATAARDAGIELVADNAGEAWMREALKGLRYYCGIQDKPFLFEDFRWWWGVSGGTAPHHHNAWGALCRVAIKDGLIQRTGVYRTTRSTRTHAHPCMTYRRAA